MPPARAALTVLLACALSASGCGASGAQPWDGHYVPLEEKGDWVDPGLLAHCEVLEDSEAGCGAQKSFNLSRCDRRSLSKLKREGIFRAELRFSAPRDPALQGRPRARGGGFRLLSGGVPASVMGSTLVEGQWDLHTLWFSGETPDGAEYSFASCEAPDERTVTGCVSVCRNGKLEETATFRAERMSWFKGEGEASGGVRLLSEAPVAAGVPMDVHVTAGHAYVVTESRGEQPGGLTVFDVRTPEAPVRVGYLRLSGDADWRGVTSAGNRLYVASGVSGVLVFDITHPADPAFVRSLPGGPLHVSHVRTDGQQLYATVVSPEPGTLVFDLAAPDTPLVHQLALAEERHAAQPRARRGAFSYGDRLYVNHRHQGFKVLDVSDPTDIRLLGTYTYPYGNSHSSAVGTFAGRTVAFETGQGLGARLRALDVTYPERIVKMGEFRLRHVVYPGTIELVGSRLYLAYHHEGLRVLDVSIPSSPREVAYFNTFRETDPGRTDSPVEGANGLHVPGDGRVYVVDTARGLLILTEPP
jgi:hypothetical protein